MKQARQNIKDIDAHVASNNLTAEQQSAYENTRAELIDLAVTNVNGVHRATMIDKANTLKTTLGM